VLNDGLGGFSTVFDIFSDCNNLPGACENKIYPIVTGHSAFLSGLLYFSQPATYSWDFGDGNTASGDIVDHTYTQTGIYNVVLQTITQDSCTDSSSVSIEISDSIPPPSCSNIISTHCNGLDVSFTGYIGTGQTASCYWDFGDGTTDTTASGEFIQHIYAQKGFYNVVLETITSDGCVSYSGYPLALIDSLDQSTCTNFILPGDVDKLTVSLHGYLYNGKPASYFWSFGDGTTATTQYVTHTYAQPGNYSISLQTLTSDSCLAYSSIKIGITDSITAGCNCGFTNSPGNNPLTKVFQAHTSSIYPTQYTWSFGDGTEGSGSNISHTFGNYGIYDVTVRCEDSTGCICISSIPVTVGDSVDPANCENWINILGIAGHTIHLYPVVMNGQMNSTFWDLGDGTTSSALEVTHTYALAGLYTVTLQTSTWNACSYQSSIVINITDSIPNGCNSYFTATAGNNLYQIHFDGFTSSQYPTTFQWNFGDPASGINNTSTVQNPDHVFSAASTYSVTLTTTDSAGCASSFSAPVILSMFTQYNLYGQVFAGSQAIPLCNVQLFGQDYTGSMNLIREVMPDSADYYTFDTVYSGIYHILATPVQGTIYAQQYLPTYFGDAFLWENSTPIVLGQPFNPYSIHLVEFDSISGGDGLINGELTTGGKSISAGNQEILILDINNHPVKYMFSLAEGSFSFAGLPYGEYKVYPVITGITTYPVTVVLSATNNTAHVVMNIKGQYVSGIGETTQADFIEKMYPNPAQNEIYVSIKSKGSVKTQVLDALGRVVYANTESISSVDNVISVPVSEFKPGLYILVIQDSTGNLSSRRFLKN
jgi:PKD repeat protein